MASSGTGRTILLVDDEPEILTSYKRLIERFFPGTQVLTADSGTSALKLVGRNRIHLILADYRMPEMDGIAFLAEARKLHPRVLGAVFTAFAGEELERRASVEAKVDDFISKDVDSAEFIRRVDRLLNG